MITVSYADFTALHTGATFKLFTPAKARRTDGLYPLWVYGVFMRLTANFAIAAAPCYPEITSGALTGDILYDENGTGSPGQHWCLGALAYTSTIDASSTNYYGFVQTWGISTAAVTMSANTSTYELIFPSSTDGKWVNEATLSASVTSTTAATVYNIPPCGMALADDDSSNVVAANKVMWNFARSCPDAIPQA